MKLSALNGFARVNPTNTVNEVDLQGHTPGHTDMNAVPVGMILRKAKRKLGKASRKEKRQARREERRANRQQRRMQDNSFFVDGEQVFSSLDDNNARKKVLGQRIEQLLDRAEKTNKHMHKSIQTHRRTSIHCKQTRVNQHIDNA